MFCAAPKIAIISILLCAQSFAVHSYAAERPAAEKSVATPNEDPFANVQPKQASPAGAEPDSAAEPEAQRLSWSDRFFSENFGFRSEIMSQFSTIGPGQSASRQSVGFEVLKKFSTATKTFLGIDIQGRVVQRDSFVGTVNDGEGMSRPNTSFEYHNLYGDVYDIFGSVGQFNLRVGRFYVPFGLNLQTDTHGTVLQLSNERNFGFERDWYTGFWGILNKDLHYDIYYLLGSGHDIDSQGQSGLTALRLSLANKYLSEYGFEGGLSFLTGERIDAEAFRRSSAVRAQARNLNVVNTFRAGVDGRYRKSVSHGLVTWASEFSMGHDKPDDVVTQLHQIDYMDTSRRWGVAAQYRWFWQDIAASKIISPASALTSTDASVLYDLTWYFRNDVGSSSLQWLKLNCEQQLQRQTGGQDVIWTFQYYQYW